MTVPPYTHRSFNAGGFAEDAAERTHAPPSGPTDGLPASAAARPLPPVSTHLRWVCSHLHPAFLSRCQSITLGHAQAVMLVAAVSVAQRQVQSCVGSDSDKLKTLYQP